MASGNKILNLIVGAEVDASVEQFKADLPKLEEKLHSLGALVKIDVSVSKESIQNIRTQIQNGLRDITFTAKAGTANNATDVKKILDSGTATEPEKADSDKTATIYNRISTSIKNAEITAQRFGDKSSAAFKEIDRAAEELKSAVNGVNDEILKVGHAMTSDDVVSNGLEITVEQYDELASSLRVLDSVTANVAKRNNANSNSYVKLGNSVKEYIDTLQKSSNIASDPGVAAAISNINSKTYSGTEELQRDFNALKVAAENAGFGVDSLKLSVQNLYNSAKSANIEVPGLEDFKNEIVDGTFSGSLTEATEKISQFKVILASMKEATAGLADTGNVKTALSGLVTELDKIDSRRGEMGDSVWSQMSTELETLEEHLGKVGLKINEVSGVGHVITITSGDIDTLQLTKEEYKQLTTEIALYLDKVKQIETVNNQTSLSFRNAKEAAESYISKIDRSNIKDGGVLAKLDDFRQKLANGGFTNEKQLTTEFNMLKRQLEDVGATSDSAFSKLRKFFTTRFGSIAVSTLFYGLIRQVKECIASIVELDSAVTDLQIATGYSKERTRELIGEYSALAVQIGATTTEVAAAADEWLRQGHSAEDATKLVNDSMMLSKLGQIDSAEATKALTSAMKGYKVEVDDVTGIVDRLTAVDMQAATSAGDIATAMAETATSARLAGVDMNTLIGYLTVVQEVTQDGAESVGNFMKTTLARYSNIKAGALTDPETAEDLSNVENALKGVGIQIRSSSGEFRDFDDVLSDVQANWKSYGSVQQKAIAVAFGGTRNQEKFLTLMDNYNTALKYSETAANSAGTAQQKYADSYLTSIEAAKNAVAAGKEQLAMSVANSDAAVNLLNIVAEILSGLAKFNELGDGYFAGVVTSVISLTGAVTALAVSTRTLASDLILAAKNGTLDTVNTATLTPLKRKLTIEILKQAVANKTLTDAQRKEIDLSIAKIAIDKKQVVSLGTLATATWSAYWPILAITAAVAAAVGVFKLYYNSVTSAAEAEEAYADSVSKLDDATSEIKENNKLLEEKRDRLVELGQIQTPSIADAAETAELKRQCKQLEEKNRLLEIQAENAKENMEIDRQMRMKAAQQMTYEKGSVGYSRFSGEKLDSFWKKFNSNSYSALSEDEALQVFTDQYLEYLSMSAEEQDSLSKKELQRYQNKKNAIIELIDVYEKYGDAEDKVLSGRAMFVLADTTTRLEMLSDVINSLEIDSNESLIDKLINGDSADTNIQTLRNYIEIIYGISDDIIEMLGNPKSDISSALSKLLDGGSVQDFRDAMEDAGYSVEQADGVIALYGVSVEGSAKSTDIFAESMNAAAEAAKAEEAAITSLSSKLEGLDKASDVIGKVKDIYDSIYGEDAEGLKFSDLSDLLQSLDDAGISADKYRAKLLAANEAGEGMDAVLSEIVDEIANNIVATEQLTDGDEELLTMMLEEQGVVNAAAVAHKSLAKQKSQNTLASFDFANANKEAISALLDESGAIGLTREQLVKLAVDEIRFGNQNLDLDQKITALENLASAYFAADVAAQAHADAESELAGAKGDRDYEDRVKRLYITKLSDAMDDADFSSMYGFSSDDADKAEDNTDHVLEAWELAVKEKKHLLSMDKITEKEYYSWIASHYDGALADEEKYADERMQIEEELYDFRKQKLQDDIDLDNKRLENAKLTGKLTNAEYAKQANAAAQENYNNLRAEIDNGLYGANEAERLGAINEGLENVHNTYVDAYEAEKKELDHQLAMNTISQEEYYSGLRSLYEKYYKDKAGYEQESYEAQEELYDQEIELAEKWATAATDSIEAVSKAMEEYVNSTKELLEGLIDANESSYNREKSLIDHQLAMNYITEDEYYKKLEDLYKTHFADKYIYMEQYWEAEEDIYKYETQALEDNRSAMESIHGEIIEMIKQELEDAKDAINETKDAYQELIDVRKKALSDQKSQEDYERERAKKLAEVEELQRQLDAVSGDSSAAGIKRRSEIQQSLTDAQEAFYDFEREHSYDTMDKSLDEQSDAITAAADSEIKSLEELLNDNEYLVSEAWKRMGAMNNTLYEQLIAYNKKYSTSIKDDITENWNAAADAARRYGTDAQAAYNSMGAAIDSRTTPYTDEDARRDETNVALKNTAEYAEVSVDYIADIASTTADLSANLVQILADITGNPYAGIAADVVGSGATSLSSIFGALTGIMSFAGGLASGSSNVQKTGVYRTDEFGEEIKLLKNTADGNYTWLTKGSVVIDSDATARLLKLMENPGLLSGAVVHNADSNVGSIKPNITNSVTDNSVVTVNPVFEIRSNDPAGVASEVKKLLPVIADYTFDVARKNSRNSGVTHGVLKTF